VKLGCARVCVCVGVLVRGGGFVHRLSRLHFTRHVHVSARLPEYVVFSQWARVRLYHCELAGCACTCGPCQVFGHESM